MKEIEFGTYAGHCEKHGDFTGKIVRKFGHEIRLICPVCAKEKSEQDKQAQEQARRLEMASGYLQFASIPERFSGKGLDTFMISTPEQRTAFDVAADYVEQWTERKRNGDSLVFLGRPGTGKTHLASAIATELCQKGYSALYLKASDVFRRIKSTYNRDSRETEIDVYRAFRRPDLLIIDEIGRQICTDAEKLAFFEVINERYENCKPMILVSNLQVSELKQYITEAGFDRLKEIGKSVIFTSESMRGRI